MATASSAFKKTSVAFDGSLVGVEKILNFINGNNVDINVTDNPGANRIDIEISATATGAGITSLNGLTAETQTFATGTSGTDFNISSVTDVHTFNLPVASATNTGKLSNTDWSIFNSKQPAGSYLTALTGDGTASGPGSATLTLATVNSNVGSFTNASITVNAKGLITAASNGSSAVTDVTATLPITSSGGSTPNISTSMATNRLIGRSTAGTGVMEEISIGTGLSLSGGILNNTITDTGITELTGDVTAGPGSGSQISTIAANAVTTAKMAKVDQYRFLARYSSGNGDLETSVLGANTVFNSSTVNFARYWKNPVRLATTVALSVTSSGVGVGQTLTATSNGALTVDGIAVAVGNRILVKDQGNSQNGIFVVADTGSAGTPFILIRATDFDGSLAGDVQYGDVLQVLTGGPGSISNGVFYYVSTTTAITVGVTTINFASNGAGNVTATGSAGKVAVFSDLDTLTFDTNLSYSIANNSMGIGASTSATARLNIAYTTNNPPTSYNGGLNSSAITLTANNANGIRGWTSSITLNPSTFNATAAIATPALEGFRSTVSVTSGGTAPSVVTAIAAYNALARNQGGGVLTNNIFYQGQAATNSGGGSITNNIVYYAAAQTVGTFNASFYGLTAAATGRFNIYMSGTAVNYFAGNTVIGSDANNAANTFAKLAVYGTTQANCRIGWGFSGTYGQTYAAAEFSSGSQNANTWSLFVNQIGGTGTQVLQFIGNGSSTFLNSISISTAAATIGCGTSGNFIAGNNTSTTVPSFVYAQGDTNTGYGRASADVANVIAGGVEVQRWNGAGNTGIGNTGTISARLHVISTTEQVRTGYDSTNYFSTTISSTGSCTFDLVGTTPKFTFSDPVIISNLTAGRILFATTSGELTDDADLTFATDTLTATKIVGSTSVKVGSVAGFISSDGSTGATGTFTTVDLKTVTVKDGIITAIV